jgi:uncharacterized peroxidase-related enzyme
MVDRFAQDWRTAGLDAPTEALLAYTEKLTREPTEMNAADVDALRGAGWDNRAITDTVQVCSYFNYINRVADGLGLEPEEWIDEWGYEF